MRGGYLHNQVMARGLTAALESLGARVWTEYPVAPGRNAGAVDIYAELGDLRLVCEIELGPRRVPKDLLKAEALGINLLLIVTPTAAEARTIRRRLATLPRFHVRVAVRAYGNALKHLSQMFPVEGGRDMKSETASRKRGAGW